LQSSPPLSHTKATMEQNRGMFRSNLLVERVELCCALHRGGACHDDVLKAGGDVILQLRHRQSRNLYVSFLGTIIADRVKSDRLEVTFLLRFPERIVKDDLSIHVPAIIPERRRCKLEDWFL